MQLVNFEAGATIRYSPSNMVRGIMVTVAGLAVGESLLIQKPVVILPTEATDSDWITLIFDGSNLAFTVTTNALILQAPGLYRFFYSVALTNAVSLTLDELL